MRTSRPLKVLVTGGTSNVGAEVAVTLASLGHHVTAVALPGFPRTHLDDRRIPLVFADVTDEERMTGLCHGQDAVVHCAAAVKFLARDRDHVYRVNVDGTRAVVRAARRAEVRRLVHMSSVAVYGRVTGRPRITEATPTQPCGLAYNDSKRDAEAAVYDGAGGVASTILRLNLVYGRYDRVFVPRVLDAFARDACRFMLGDPDRPLSVVGSEYVAQAVARLLDRPAIARVDKYIVSEGEPPTFRRFFEALAALVGRQAPSRALPGALGLAYGRVCDLLHRLGRPPALSMPYAEAANMLVDAIFDGSALRRRLDLPTVDSLANVQWMARRLMESAERKVLPLVPVAA
jgi:dihydroflavonol-4-reductase